MYYNTTKETKNLKDYQKKAKTQDETILEFFKVGVRLSPSLIFPLMNCPVTSIRRSLNTLANPKKVVIDDNVNIHISPKIERTDIKIMGMYGRMEYLYKLC